jgi:hypothetical protein
LLVGREDLGGGEIKDGEDGVGIVDCENFIFINYIDRCTISLHSANLVINIVIAEITNTY